MKVLSLIQPYATLVVIGAKKIETRSFNTEHRGTILIHASKKMPVEYRTLALTEPFYNKLKHLEELPLGCIIGKADLAATGSTDMFKSLSKDNPKTNWVANVDWDSELQFGNYSADRYGWLLEKPVMFKHHIPFIGGVGFTKDFEDRICLSCGCTEYDCSVCIKETGHPCYWADQYLCSACVVKK